MTTSKIRFRLMLAGVLAAGVFGAIAVKLAWATPGQGITITPISGPTVLDEIDTKSETDTHEVELKTRGLSDVYVAHIRVVPGGHGGWHYHPGPSIISVISGTATFYLEDDPTEPHVFPAGTGFVEDAERVHLLVNEGDVDVELVVLQIVPLGAPRRIDAPAPE